MLSELELKVHNLLHDERMLLTLPFTISGWIRVGSGLSLVMYSTVPITGTYASIVGCVCVLENAIYGCDRDRDGGRNE